MSDHYPISASVVIESSHAEACPKPVAFNFKLANWELYREETDAIFLAVQAANEYKNKTVNELNDVFCCGLHYAADIAIPKTGGKPRPPDGLQQRIRLRIRQRMRPTPF